MEAKEIIFLDNTRISGCKGCPMYYCIKSKLGWVPSKARPPLDFGGSWHEGKAEIFREIKKRKETFPRSPIPDDQYWTDVHERAFESFMTEWHKRGLPDPSEAPEMMELYFPRVPGTAREMLWHYIDQNKLRLWEIEILDIERPFVVPLFETETQKVFLVGRRDLTYRDHSGVWAMEHKTSTLGAAAKYMAQGQIFQRKFLQSFSMSPQVAGYTYSLKLEYGTEARGVMISGDLVHREHNNKFHNIPVWKDDSWLEGWYNDTKYWVERLLHYDSTGFYPHNETSCETQYGPCEYKEICEVCPDPRKLPNVWVGFKVDFWEPFDEEAMKDIMKRAEGA